MSAAHQALRAASGGVEFSGMTEDQLRAWILKEAQARGLGGLI